MRKLFLSILILTGYFVSAQMIETKDLPTAVKSKFETLYPDVKDAKWGKMAFNYEAEFTANEISTSVLFDMKGNALETDCDSKISELPKPIIEYFNKNYPWKKIKHAVKITDVNGRITYRVGIGVKPLDIVFDFQGNFLRILKL